MNTSTRSRLILAMLAPIVVSFSAMAATYTIVVDSVSHTSTYTDSIFFHKASSSIVPEFAGNAAHIDSITSFMTRAGADSLLSVTVTGSYSHEGSRSYNTALALARAKTLADAVVAICPGAEPNTQVKAPGNAPRAEWPALRYAELQLVYRLPVDSYPPPFKNEFKADESLNSNDLANVPTSDTLRVESALTAPAETATAETQDKRHGIFGSVFVTTNMLYDAALTPNIGAGLRLGDRFTLQADYSYARWSCAEKCRYWRIYTGDVELRYRFAGARGGSPLAGHYVGLYGSMLCYDIQAGMSHKGFLSDKYNYAAGLSYTFTLPVARRLNIDFNIGIGYLWGNYKKSRHIDDHDVWLSTHKLGWFGPTRAGVTLVWLLGSDLTNDRKGGRR